MNLSTPLPSPSRHYRGIVVPLSKIPCSLRQHIPAWKLESLGRNMTAAFAREGDDASLLCADPGFSYFLFSGILMIEDTTVRASPLPSAPAPLFYDSSKSHRAPTEEVAAVTGSKVGETSTRTGSPKGGKAELFLRPFAREIEKPPRLAFCSWTHPYDSNSIGGSALSPEQGNGGDKMDDRGSDLGSAVSRSLFSFPMTTSAKISTSPSAPDVSSAASTRRESARERVEGCPLFPGQSLDTYVLHKPVDAAEQIGSGGHHDQASLPGTTSPRRWRLEAQECVCVGRVSRHFLHELGRQEPTHDIEERVAFLRKTEASEKSLNLMQGARPSRAKHPLSLTDSRL